MKLHTIKSNKGARKRSQRIGRGIGSGRGTYSTRGNKGQMSRSGARRNPGFEGGQTRLVMRMPKLKGFKNPNKVIFQTVNVGELNIFEDGSVVDLTLLLEKSLVSKKNKPVKMLGTGELSKKLTIRVDAISASAKEKVEKNGGTVEIPGKKPATPAKSW